MTTWKHAGEWTMSLFSWTSFSKMYEDGRDCNPMFFEFKDNISVYYQTEEELERVKQNIVKKVSRDPGFLQKRLTQIEKQLKKDTKELNEINKKLKSRNYNLAQLFSKYCELFRKTIFGMAIDIYFDDILCDKLKHYLTKRLQEINKENKLNEYYSLLTAPIKLTTTQKEELAFLNILLKYKKQKEGLFKKHLKKYSFIPMWFDNLSWNISDLESRAKIFKDEKEVEKRLKELQDEVKNRKQKIRKIIAELKPPREIKEFIQIIQEFAFLRQQGEAQISYHNFHGLKLKEEICNQLDITMKNLKFLTDEEIIKNLKKRSPLLKEIIKERQKYCFMIMKDGKYTIYTGERARKKAQKIKDKIPKEKVFIPKIIKGVVGSIGYVKGKVCVLHGLSDNKKIKAGEIMVVSGTSIEYLSAMHKAAAIIAEIGGITSHAAVVSRELRKPCITRVEHATKIFKDGDLIEVDANKGIVRKLK